MNILDMRTIIVLSVITNIICALFSPIQAAGRVKAFVHRVDQLMYQGRNMGKTGFILGITFAATRGHDLGYK